MLTRSKNPLDVFNGRSRHGPGFRVRRARFFRNLLKILAVPAVIIALIAAFNLVRDMLEADANHLAVLGYEGRPLPGALITTDTGNEVTTVEGGSAFIPFDVPASLHVEAPGYKPATFQVDALPGGGPLYLQMEPMVLQGRVTDLHGNGVVGAQVTAGDKTTITAEFGAFEVVGAAPGPVTISKSAWDDTQFTWDGREGRVDVEMRPFVVRGLRVYGFSAADDQVFNNLLRIADATSVNALVFDTKSEGGEVLYNSHNEDALKSEAILNLYDVEERLRQTKEHGLYAITRIVTFQDLFQAEYRPDHAIMDSETGDIWRNNKGLGWLDPTDEGSWEYPIALGVEACRLGFDEIQFDYARFPTDGDISTTVYDNPNTSDPAVRVETIANFLAAARQTINAEGCAVSVDIFAIVLSVQDDQGLGQRVEELSWSVDAISPMVYPSHYSPGWLGLDNPNDHPEEVVGEALGSGVVRLEGGALMRPWLQGFSWSPDEVQESIMTAEEIGTGWMLWNAQSLYEMDFIPDLGPG